MKDSVPFVDLKTQFSSLRDEIMVAVEAVFESSEFILGDAVNRFEQEFATFCESAYAVSVASGTDALKLSLMACGVQPGDEVIVPANTYIATALAISDMGAVPVFMDVSDDDLIMDVALLSAACSEKTRALIPVHLFGKPADMDGVMAMAESRGLKVIEDACQAHGARYKGVRVGSLGNAAAFSFYPGKNLGAYGDGGAVVTQDSDVARMLDLLRNYGQSKKYYHDVRGFNSRLDSVQAAILLVKLKHLDEWTHDRQQVASWYRIRLNEFPLWLPGRDDRRESVQHLFPIRTPLRDALQKHMEKDGIQSGIHYPVPIHLQMAFTDLGYSRGSFPVSEKAADELLSLPMFPEMTEGQVDRVCQSIRSFFDGVKS